MTFEQSAEIDKLAQALVAFQKKVGKIGKSEVAKVGTYTYQYASLSSILEAIKEPLTENGLSIVQLPSGPNELMTQLNHTSGQWMRASYPMTPTDTKPQAIGSAITYQRRYAMGALLCLDIDKDDDGATASASLPASKPAPAAPRAMSTAPEGDSVQEILVESVESKQGKNGEYKLIHTAEGGLMLFNKDLFDYFTDGARLKVSIHTRQSGDKTYRNITGVETGEINIDDIAF
jgi:ERF superfamily.